MMSLIAVVAVLSLTLRSVVADEALHSAVFRATHNSYSGNVDGAKDTIKTQLDRGVRFIEFDLHDNNYTQNGDYGVGHNEPGDAVDHTAPNPSGNLLRDWLNVVNSWSAANPSHAPIVMMLDIKDDLTDNANFAEGNLAALNQRMKDVFGASLLWSQNAPQGLPSVEALRGRIVPVLSGDSTTRSQYKSDSGSNPAVARNSQGLVVEVHDDGGSNLWYWSGKIASNGTVVWLRHGKYDTGKNPAIAMNDDGWIVEVHQSSVLTKLWSHTGRVDPNTGEITWSGSLNYDNGVNPTVEFLDPAGSAVREVHKSQSNSQNWQWSGALSTSSTTGSIAWSGNAKTSDAILDKTQSNGIAVLKDSGGKLAYSAGQIVGKRIAYEQIFFVEFQPDNSAELQDGAIFYAGTSTDKSFISSAISAGKVVRGWDFDSASDATTPLANYPATNHPYDSWYDQLVTSSNAVQ